MSKDNKYLLTVGIETHVQLKTKSKLFSGADNQDQDVPANSLVNHIDFGLPGALPVLNKKAIELASRAAFALNSQPQKFSKFDRKHYFYPDLPMGYQITQYDQPIILGGYVEFVIDDKIKKVDITRAHLEADAGKSLHPDAKDYSLVDLNRAGTPLLEIVSEPQMHSPAEAKAYARELYLLMRYANVSNANLYFGNMRFDVNVSLSTNDQLGVRTETKNLNSFRSVEKAIIFEMQRQQQLLDKKQPVIQETRGWDDAKNRGYSMRTKENADDYRYMPDPDLPPVVLDDQYIKNIQSSMPKLPSYWRQALSSHNLSNSMIESLIEGQIEFNLNHLEYLAQLKPKQTKSIANYIVNIELPLLSQAAERKQPLKLLKADELHKLYEQVNEMYITGSLSSTNVKKLLTELILDGQLPKNLASYIKQAGLTQTSDETTLKQIVDQILNSNPKAIKDIKNGQEKAVGYLVGLVMQATKGQANPTVVKELINDSLRNK